MPDPNFGDEKMSPNVLARSPRLAPQMDGGQPEEKPYSFSMLDEYYKVEEDSFGPEKLFKILAPILVGILGSTKMGNMLPTIMGATSAAHTMAKDEAEKKKKHGATMKSHGLAKSMAQNYMKTGYTPEQSEAAVMSQILGFDYKLPDIPTAEEKADREWELQQRLWAKTDRQNKASEMERKAKLEEMKVELERRKVQREEQAAQLAARGVLSGDIESYVTGIATLNPKALVDSDVIDLMIENAGGGKKEMTDDEKRRVENEASGLIEPFTEVASVEDRPWWQGDKVTVDTAHVGFNVRAIESVVGKQKALKADGILRRIYKENNLKASDSGHVKDKEGNPVHVDKLKQYRTDALIEALTGIPVETPGNKSPIDKAFGTNVTPGIDSSYVDMAATETIPEKLANLSGDQLEGALQLYYYRDDHSVTQRDMDKLYKNYKDKYPDHQWWIDLAQALGAPVPRMLSIESMSRP